jgi:hypothetical protein
MADASDMQQTVHDVAITNIQIQGAGGTVSQGDTINLDVTVENLGSVSETFPVGLHDDTDIQVIDTISVTLNTGQISAVSFQWDTSSASPGDHFLTATVSVANDQDASNDSITISSPINVTLPAPPSDSSPAAASTPCSSPSACPSLREREVAPGERLLGDVCGSRGAGLLGHL